MKLTLAVLSTTALLATGASAMVGNYERAVNNADASSALFTTGMEEVKPDTDLASPGAEWRDGDTKTITVFSNKEDAGQFFGAAAR